MGMFISCDMCCWMDSGVLKKKSCDLARLKVVLDASLKSLRMDLSLLASCVVGVFRSIVSSTNWLWEVSVVTHVEGGLEAIHFELRL
jgi:hypothetical protein